MIAPPSSSSFLSAPSLPFPLPSALGDAALAYAQAGLPVFPLRPRGKAPLVKRGFYAATTDERQVHAWWKRWPDANIGIPTGSVSGWIALDVDPRNGGWASFKALRTLAAQTHVDLLATCCQRSGGGGIHLLFALREDLPFKHASTLRGYAGIDLKGHGGYLSMTPSSHPSGGRYQWLRVAPLAPFPEVLIALARPHSPVSHPALFSQETTFKGQERQEKQTTRDPGVLLDLALARSQEGTRHHAALFLACRLVEAGVPTTEAERFMCLYAQMVLAGTHPFPEQEALACLHWARAMVLPH